VISPGRAVLLLAAVLALSTATAAEHRTLLLRAPTADHPQLLAQRAILDADPDGLSERDVAVVMALDPAGPQRFEAVLVGKDGREKLRQSTPLSLAALYALIDAMPMRKAEQRRRAQ